MSKLSVKTKEVKFPIAPDLYGLFYEDINRSGDGGLYPEMLRNRSFEDSIPPERCVVSEDGVKFTTPLGWTDQFNNGEGLAKWMNDVPPTPIPAWYAQNASMKLDFSDTLNPKRLASLRVSFNAGGILSNIGYQGIAYRKGASYPFYMFAKAIGQAAQVKVAILSADGAVQDEKTIDIQPGEFRRYDCAFTATQDEANGTLRILSPESQEILIGFSSLMPADTFKGHGMRKDLMELLDGINAKFLRFPGGCIVEGFTRETAMRFPNTIGPVWERPSHQLMWHYRTSNGLGFHEYLQICEDLGLEAMYVINCGMTCQARAMELFEDEELQAFLQEAYDAIEYATGDAATPMGKKRAENGHPEPFTLAYIEIGNENSGPEYHRRYKMFYDALKARYPDIKYISNTHTEREGLPTEIADEHFYNTPEFFMENMHKYDDYDRNGPDIFVGEYAVTTGAQTATLRCALAESMFLLGIEENQDIVRLAAFAPLFENVDYISWFPNLIRFNTHQSFGIASYHTLSLLGKYRGKSVVRSEMETEDMYRQMVGLPGIFSAKGGLQFQDATVDGKPVSIAHHVQGDTTGDGGIFTTIEDPNILVINRDGYENSHRRTGVAFGEDYSDGVFEITAKSDADNPISIVVWCYRPYSVFRIDETAEEKFDMRSIHNSLWTLNGATSKVTEGRMFRQFPLGEEIDLPVNLGEYNTYRVVTHSKGFDCYLNGKLVHQAQLPSFPAVSALTTVDGDDVLIKIINITDKPDAVTISLDCQVEDGYTVECIAGDDPDMMNSFEQPEAVSAVMTEMSGASSSFVHQAPAYSLSVLRLKQKRA